jgi:cytosine/adenosine deaminase-related metal-dependent hydrolase
MPVILVDNALVLVTMDGERREIEGGSVLVRDNVIEALGSRERIHQDLDGNGLKPDRVIDASGCIVVPGLVNCHHHLFQTLTRTLGTAGGKSLFDWLQSLYPLWGQMDAQSIYVSARLGLVELMLSGATTVADHLYLFPGGARLDDEIRAARELGVRFHPTRGSMSLGQSRGGLPPDDICEDEDRILADCERVIAEYHDPQAYSMLRIGLAPCSPFSVSPELLRRTAELARRHSRVGLHTHLAETLDENRYCEAHFGLRPLAYVESLGWSGVDVWFAHMVHPDGDEIDRLAASASGVCHCPSSNMILASGIAPLRAMRDAGVRLGLGVDGSASNDGNQLLGEARQAMLLQRVGWPGFESSADRFAAREALELATRGGAEVLGRDDIGSLEPGKAADLVAYRVDGIQHAGAGSDPVAALVTCAPVPAWLSLINGRIVVEQGRIPGLDLDTLVHQHNRLAAELLQRAARGTP